MSKLSFSFYCSLFFGTTVDTCNKAFRRWWGEKAHLDRSSFSLSCLVLPHFSQPFFTIHNVFSHFPITICLSVYLGLLVLFLPSPSIKSISLSLSLTLPWPGFLSTSSMIETKASVFAFYSLLYGKKYILIINVFAKKQKSYSSSENERSTVVYVYSCTHRIPEE